MSTQLLRFARSALKHLPCHPLRNVVSFRTLTVLAVESSADDTCAAVVDSNQRILSNVVIRSFDELQKWGGIHPAVAILEHQRNMPIAVKRALEEAKMNVNDVDGIAFTRGPGIAGCLAVGTNAAKTLAAALGKPLVGVHHMQAHALTALLTSSEHEMPTFPFLTLLVSGGHTLILLARSNTSFQILATTPDESIGRTIDKVSRMLDLKWDGIGPGAALERFCASNEDSALPADFRPFPRPLHGELAFSYSSMHSHVERFFHARGGLQSVGQAERLAIARAFQEAVFRQLVDKLKLAFDWCERKNVKVRHLVVSGGVASNSLLRQRLKECLEEVQSEEPIVSVFPPPSLCTDNAVMIAWAAMHRLLARDYDEYTIAPRSKWSIEDICSDKNSTPPTDS
ncbi:o-sialoglycoprotein endopeptidase [Moniliophthora roreri MCA 2997]|uniref:N(6)-L-threonylcarbamoyladenine synthase n=2 Tax=Moniliophthora roreri TaxID=221103 RepID=V2XL02_MONRO|nr:o-sialoglycoprotein endopeptidase [Moniliophthora roreri MCA 2997]KAI3598544.1 o-sialoglycoprotein endopeptidase [Moniliophthora roreri]